MIYATAILSVSLFLTVGVISAPPAAAAPTGVSSCQALDSPGAYELTTDLTAVDATCIEITSSDVTLNLAGRTMACTGTGFAGSCQVPEFTSHGVFVAPGVGRVAVKGPGLITGFDNGVTALNSDVIVKSLTITGPGCDPSNCEQRPPSAGIVIVGGLNAPGPASANVSGNHTSNHLSGIVLFLAKCAGGDAGCVVKGNVATGNSCLGISLPKATGWTLTRNVTRGNGIPACFPTAGIGDLGTGNVLTNNDSSDNVGFGIAAAPGSNGNLITHNTARGNTLADLRGFPGTENTWLDNNRCNTESGAVPPSVCNPGE